MRRPLVLFVVRCCLSFVVVVVGWCWLPSLTVVCGLLVAVAVRCSLLLFGVDVCCCVCDCRCSFWFAVVWRCVLLFVVSRCRCEVFVVVGAAGCSLCDVRCCGPVFWCNLLFLVFVDVCWLMLLGVARCLLFV